MIRDSLDTVLLMGDALNCNSYTQHNIDSVMSLIDSPEESELVIIHPDTECLSCIALGLMAFMAILTADEIDVEGYYEQFEVGDMVIRSSGARYRYGGIENGRVLLKSDDTNSSSNNIDRIPLERGLDIRLYNGQATTTGATGRNKAISDGEKCLECILGKEFRSEIVLMSQCILVVCEREKTERLINHMALKSLVGKADFSDAFPVAWARSEDVDDWVFLGGNVGRSNPAIILTNRISVARSILYADEDEENRICAVILDDTVSVSNIQEINDIREIVKEKSNGKLLILQSESHISGLQNLELFKRTGVLHWTTDLLLSTIEDLYAEPKSVADIYLKDTLARTIDHSREIVSIAGPIEISGLVQCKKLLKRLIRDDQRDDNISEFILCAYGLVNLFEQACFTMNQYEMLIEAGRAKARSPKKQVQHLFELIEKNAEYDCIGEMEEILLYLDDAYKALLDSNPKREQLLKIVNQAKLENRRIGIAITKRAYFNAVTTLFEEPENPSVYLMPEDITDERLDIVVFVATPNVKKNGYNPLSFSAVPEIKILEYPSERIKNQCYQRQLECTVAFIQKAANEYALNHFGEESVDLEENETTTLTDEECKETEDIETELANIETEAVVERAIATVQSSSHTTIKAIRLAQFVSGEWSVFSKYYSAYVLDIDKGIIIEKPTQELQVGDVVVFSAASTEMSDFIGDILERLVEKQGNGELVEHYKRSKRWKRVLSEYVVRTGSTFSEMSKTMADLGHARHQATIKYWLREDSATIGPHDSEAYLAIGLLTNDADMETNYSLYKESCDYVRRQRTRILNYVQRSIIRSTTKQKSDSAMELSAEELRYLGDVSRYARRLTIERIVPCEREVPSYLVNRPIEGRE